MKTLLTNAQIRGVQQNLLIEDNRITYIGKNIQSCDQEIDLSGKIILPGVIDPHTHIRDLKQSAKEDWTSASNAAIRGGTTTVFDMPNTNPPTINLEYLNMKRERAKAAKINYMFNIAATSENLKELIEILDSKPEDIAALKMFLAGSNSDEFVDDDVVLNRIFEIAYTYDFPLMVHTELQGCIDIHAAEIENPDVRDHNFIRNSLCSVNGTELLIKYAKKHGTKLYLAHTSTGEEMDMVKENKEKCNLFCETTPHHLLINEDVLETAGNFGKVNPPLRTQKDNDRIMKAINEGTVDTIGTDHAPHQLSEKLKPYAQAPSGFPGLEVSLPLLLNEVNKGSFSLEKLVDITSFNSSEIFKLKERGKLEEGFFADLTVVDMEKEWTIESDKFLTKAKYSPYEGMQGKGDIEMTFVNGQLLYQNK